MIITGKKDKKLNQIYQKFNCIPGSSIYGCLENNQSQRHLKTYHNDYFLYKNRNGTF